MCPIPAWPLKGLSDDESLNVVPSDSDVYEWQASRAAIWLANFRHRVESGQTGFGLEALITAMAARFMDRQLSQISIHELPFRTVQHS